MPVAEKLYELCFASFVEENPYVALSEKAISNARRSNYLANYLFVEWEKIGQAIPN